MSYAERQGGQVIARLEILREHATDAVAAAREVLAEIRSLEHALQEARTAAGWLYGALVALADRALPEEVGEEVRQALSPICDSPEGYARWKWLIDGRIIERSEVDGD